jgi:hypothetical protein
VCVEKNIRDRLKIDKTFFRQKKCQKKVFGGKKVRDFFYKF